MEEYYMTRGAFNYILQTKANNNIENISSIIPDNHSPLYVQSYLTAGKGIKYIDEAISETEYLTGILCYGLIAYSERQAPNERAEYFIPVEDIKGVSWKTQEKPDYVNE